MSIPLNTIYSYFESGDFPTQKQFQDSWSSFWHKDESIPTSKITGLDSLLQNKADKNIFETHVSNPDSHTNYLAKRDASNLNSENIQSWKTTLGVKELLSNLATFDDGSNTGNVFTKLQSDSRYMFLDDFVNADNKILAEKIEALVLTTLIEVVETTISEFAGNSNSYEFEDNDFIAIPDNNGNFSLFMFKGGEKTEKKNYLPTGISNVTIGMVEGLQAALNTKADKTTLDSHVSNADSHANYLAKRDASNLNSENIQSWKTTLGVKELLSNLATFDDGSNTGNVFTKLQSDSKYMFLSEFLNGDHKILAEKIEALGLTTLIQASEKNILDFALNSAAYKFENNDFIAVPDERGNFSLHMFKGGEKTEKGNYLPTGISNVTIGMVEGLQGELNKIQVVQDGLTNLNTNLQYKADKTTLDSHISNADSHANYLAKRDASNLNSENIQSWKTTLGVKELLSNLATFDDGSNTGNVFTKLQSDSKYMFLSEFLNGDHKILAEKIEALGLTTLIQASEKNILDFALNSAAYKFEDNDFIAVPDERGNFSLHMFKGGEKTEKGNYLPTGISNVTIGMVEGLQGELNKIQVVQDGLTNLNTNLQYKADKNIFDSHISNADSHANYLAKRDASNLNSENIQSWKTTLGVKELLSNLATFDDGSNTGNVFTKLQSDSKYMFLSEFLNGDHKILAEKIEALGLTTLIEASEKSITEFAARSDVYKFENNDFIAVPDSSGNFSLFMFKGGEKTEKGNYLPTGISNVTIGMVEGLQGELNKIQVVQDGLTNLNTNLQYKADKTTLDSHISNADSHANYLAKRDASNLNSENIQSWKTTLGVKELLSNLATFDDGSNTGNVYTKNQSDGKIEGLQGELANLNTNLQYKADKNIFDSHVWSPDSHISYLATRDASNLDYDNVYNWQTTLGIRELLEHRTNYKIYRALLEVDDKSFEPKFTVLENTIGDISWKRNDVGFYTGSLEKAFSKGKVWINSKINIPFRNSSPVDCAAVRIDDNAVNLNIFSSENYNPVDMEGEFGIIEIYVYDNK
jgi:accessory gene regulator protein AgrB